MPDCVCAADEVYVWELGMSSPVLVSSCVRLPLPVVVELRENVPVRSLPVRVDAV